MVGYNEVHVRNIILRVLGTFPVLLTECGLLLLVLQIFKTIWQYEVLLYCCILIVSLPHYFEIYILFISVSKFHAFMFWFAMNDQKFAFTCVNCQLRVSRKLTVTYSYIYCPKCHAGLTSYIYLISDISIVLVQTVKALTLRIFQTTNLSIYMLFRINIMIGHT